MINVSITTVLSFLMTAFFAVWPQDAGSQDETSQFNNQKLDFYYTASLTRAVSNNAVAAFHRDGTTYLYSFMGIDSSKNYRGITRSAFGFDSILKEWKEIPPVPGSLGRLAATAQAVRGKIYIFSGYTLDDKGGEVSVPDVNIYDPVAYAYSLGAPMPLPSDDAVSGVWNERYIYIISGWSQKENINNVQVYDTVTNSWQQATAIPGPPVFGHAGGIVDDTIIYCDGVKIDSSKKPRFVMSEESYKGKIDPENPAKISWQKIMEHPGPAKYRMAAGSLPERGWILFTGGTVNPYNYDGIGYNNIRSEPEGTTFAYDVRNDRWISLENDPDPAMDHRGIVGFGNEFFTIGGMGKGQQVSKNVKAIVIR